MFTDNNPLLYIMEASKLNAHGQRWVSELSEFNFNIKYRPGVINRDADCLSHLPLNIKFYETLCTEEIKPDAFQAMVVGLRVQKSNEEVWLSTIVGNKIIVIDPSLLLVSTFCNGYHKSKWHFYVNVGTHIAIY